MYLPYFLVSPASYFSPIFLCSFHCEQVRVQCLDQGTSDTWQELPEIEPPNTVITVWPRTHAVIQYQWNLRRVTIWLKWVQDKGHEAATQIISMCPSRLRVMTNLCTIDYSFLGEYREIISSFQLYSPRKTCSVLFMTYCNYAKIQKSKKSRATSIKKGKILFPFSVSDMPNALKH